MDDLEWLLINGQEILKTSSLALTYPLCDHCLGRLFARSGYGLSNDERGRSVRTVLALSHELLKDQKERIPLGFEDQLPIHQKTSDEIEIEEKKSEDDGWNTVGTRSISTFLQGEQEGDCWLCNDVFKSKEELADLIFEKSKDQEFSTFLIGCKIDPGTNERERKVWEISNPSSAEPIKEELNREIGKVYGRLAPEKEFNRGNPEVAFLVDPLFKKVNVTIKPLFVKGRYRKFERGIPQTRWMCKSCHGKGCGRCEGKGKMYETSVEEIIGTPLMEAAKGENFKLHGKGREDIDVLTLGPGRPFILEITGPKIRSLDLDTITEVINQQGNGKAEIDGLVFTSRKEVPRIKEGSSKKRYRARIAVKGDVEEETLKYNISLLSQSPINQRTPRRVSHRRADKIRTRMVHEITTIIEDGNTAVVDLLTDGGLYIKELFHGDDGRTDPSLASLLGVEVVVDTLDVIDVLDEEET
jgi:tRNA pseudouridine synthase 10